LLDIDCLSPACSKTCITGSAVCVRDDVSGQVKFKNVCEKEIEECKQKKGDDIDVQSCQLVTEIHSLPSFRGNSMLVTNETSGHRMYAL
jgi:hypothetical protein